MKNISINRKSCDTVDKMKEHFMWKKEINFTFHVFRVALHIALRYRTHILLERIRLVAILSN